MDGYLTSPEAEVARHFALELKVLMNVCLVVVVLPLVMWLMAWLAVRSWKRKPELSAKWPVDWTLETEEEAESCGASDE